MSNTGRQLIVTQEEALFAFLSGFCTLGTSAFPKTQLRVSNALDRCFPAASRGSIRKPTTCCRARVRGQNYQKKEKNQTNKHNSDSLRGESQTVFQWWALSHTIKPTNPKPAERHLVWQDAAGPQWHWAEQMFTCHWKMFQSMEKQVWTPQGEIFDESRQPFPPLDLPDFEKQADRREKLKKTGLSEKIKCTSHVSS